jgi:hypothetical protein
MSLNKQQCKEIENVLKNKLKAKNFKIIILNQLQCLFIQGCLEVIVLHYILLFIR